MTLADVANASEQILWVLKTNTPKVLWILAILWLFNLINWYLLKGRLNYLGIVPRSVSGVVGIIFSPILHGNVNHLFFNTVPLFFLMNFVLVAGVHSFICITLVITCVAGCIVWLIGRPAIHIGASSLMMGYWSYMFVNAYKNPSALTLILVLVTVYYLGSMVANLLPSGPGISWEGHVAGFIAGFVPLFWCPLT